MRNSLEVIVFVAGAAVMVLELVGSRLVAPYFGTSLFVWTSLIGVVLGFLSVGYWLGGRLADRRPDYGTFSLVLLAAGALTAAVAVVGDLVLVVLQAKISDVRVGAVVASSALFGAPALLCGMVSPYAAKLKLSDVGRAGATVGALYALSTLGSIAGTFLCGFVLISRFTTSGILFAVAAALAALSVITAAKKWSMVKALLLLAFLSGAFAAESFGSTPGAGGFFDINTPYNRVWVFDGYSTKNNARMRIMQINDEASSAMFIESDDLVHDYTKYYRLARHFHPGLKKALMIGGAGYSYPKAFLAEYPDATLDVVEIDPKLTEIAERHFRLKPDPRLKILHEDGRTFLNRDGEKYDVVYGDAFRSLSVPFHLISREAVARIHARLSDDGVFLVNLFSAVDGEKGRLLRAVLVTLKSVFPRVHLYAVGDPEDGGKVQNLMVVALKGNKHPRPYSTDPELNGYLFKVWIKPIAEDLPILTDAHAPVEEYTLPVIARVHTKRLSPMRERFRRFFKPYVSRILRKSQ